MTTPDREADADEALAQAIRNHADTIPDATGGRYSLLDSYAVIACWAPDVEGEEHAYTLHFHRRTIPTHVAIGLFAQAAGLVGIQGGDEP